MDLPKCPIETTMVIIGSKWKILIIRELTSGTKRFGELKKSINGISQKMLTSSLRELEDNKIVTRKVYPEIPPKVEYTLSDLGVTLKEVIDSMGKWGEYYKEKINN